MDDKTKNAIALKKFSIIGPVLNGQISSNTEYFLSRWQVHQLKCTITVRVIIHTKL